MTTTPLAEPSDLTRRRFLRTSRRFLGLGASLALVGPAVLAAPAVVSNGRPNTPDGIQLGDPSDDGLVVWARAERQSRMVVEYATEPGFRNPMRISGPLATSEADLTARTLLTGLLPGQQYHVRVAFENPEQRRGMGAWTEGSFRTPSQQADRPIRFVWSGDTVGQGWGINPDLGGMRIYEAMRQRNPDFFIHSGDTIYADSPITAEQKAEDGRIWRNLVTEEVSKVAETLKEFRGRHRYNMMDTNVRRFASQVPQIWQWDDHEITNNWSASKDLSGDARYTEKDVRVLVARGSRAFLENAPMRWHRQGLAERVHRKIGYGPLLDVFVLDMRSFRGPNGYNRETTESAATAFLGNAQLEWLVAELMASRATWKVIAADMPIGLGVPDGKDAQGRPRWEAIANGDGPALGRELETARLLTRIRQAGIKNVVWVTADVHYCAAHHYSPERAVYKDFDPFWEFVAGPLNAGSFGPNPLDNTFGPHVAFQKAPTAQNMSPFAGYQFFGEVNIDPASRALTVDLRDLNGVSQYSQTLQAQA
ncbi:alkaline phosphatase D family protein [Cupriavidus metallidurans]|uniref:alkaline phosphatase D family protein n=1 Tax=Cupriavidus metallidurans TaxID=119219 RepID=UPI00068A4CC3|nr:alkaline phosphatase D family protein [Cupriavidus metallidurans]